MAGDVTAEIRDAGPKLCAAQQPDWRLHPDYADSMDTLALAPGLVTESEIAELSSSLALAAAGKAQILQAGDCAESFHELAPEHTAAKLALLHGLADRLTAGSGQSVLRIGRIGGQFAKPRSAAVESVGGIALPAFRGHLVNSEELTPEARRHDPRRMVTAYQASGTVLGRLRADRAARQAASGVIRGAAGDGPVVDGPWSSHDALVLDYELSLVRAGRAGRYLSSTHLPWLGDRTRQPNSAHVRLLSEMANPVACKIGPTTGIYELRELCERLDPNRVPGRLVLIVRLGKETVSEALPAMLAAVRAAGHPAIWLTDPMHGNTIRVDGDRKTRRLDDVIAEAIRFRRIVERSGAHPGGLHLEAAPGVTECVGGTVQSVADLGRCYTTLCDPRLNAEQATELVEAWLRG